jgi:hypothetical protein
METVKGEGTCQGYKEKNEDDTTDLGKMNRKRSQMGWA